MDKNVVSTIVYGISRCHSNNNLPGAIYKLNKHKPASLGINLS